MVFNQKKFQAEIFGVALFFVIILVGFLVFLKFSDLGNSSYEKKFNEDKYKILSSSTVNFILEKDTGCYVDKISNSVKNVINYCIQNSYKGSDEEIECKKENFKSCQHSIDLINKSLRDIYSKDIVAEIPYRLEISVPDKKSNLLHNQNFTNLGEFKTINGDNLTLENYRQKGYKRQSSGLINWITDRKQVKMVLYLYYK